MADETPVDEAAQPEAPQAPEAPAGTEAPAEGGTAEATEATPAELNESLRQMNASLEELKAERKPEVDPLDRLLGQEPEGDYEYEDEQQPAAPEQQLPPDEDADLVNELRELVREEATGIIRPVFEQQETARREQAIRGLAEQYPDLAEHADEISRTLDALATRYGNPHLRTEPMLVEQTYQAIKARAAAGAETPAAEAAGRGAVLEQGAGPGVPEGETDPVQEEYDRVFANLNPGSGDAIT